MKPNATPSTQPTKPKRRSHPGSFAKVFDGRNQPVRGLWVRNGRYYAQLTIEDPNTGSKSVRRVPVLDKDRNPVTTVAQAKDELNRMKAKRSDNDLPNLRRTPKFSEYVNDYFEFVTSGGNTDGAGNAVDGEDENDKAKKPGTIEKEKYTLAKWVKHLGDLRVDQIRRVHINAFIQKRKKGVERKKRGVKNRTVNLDVTALRNVLKKAIDDGHIRSLPTANMRPLKTATKKRPLFAHDRLEKLCAAAFQTRKDDAGALVPVTKNAQEFTDYIRFLAYTGARRNEGLAVRWADVDFDGQRVTIGADADTKNSQERKVQFNPKLKALLLAMQTRRAPDSKWLFPSPQRGERDIHAKSFRESLELARKQAQITNVGFHDFRHLFISYCVMSGIDYMTIAEWVGHRDGGVLIGKVYGHLADEHKQAMAAKVNFEPVILKAKAA